MILVDASPLQTEHRYRGPGVYTAGLLGALAPLLDGLDSEEAPRLGLLLQSPRPADLPLTAALAERPGIEVIRLHRPRWPRYRLQAVLGPLAVRPVVRRTQPALYHATEPNGLVHVPGVPTVATLYDLIPLHYPDAHLPYRRLDQRLGYGRYLRLLRRTDRLIAISEATRRDAAERLRIPPERFTVIPLAVDEARFTPRPPEEIEAAVARHGLRRPYFLHVGASAYHKNTAAMLRAFERFRDGDATGHSLYIAGQWSPRALAALEATYPDLLANGRLRVLGYVADDELPALYGGATALVYPSLIEGFGLPVLEAMRCATPVLTSTASSLPEVAGDAALLVDPRDPEAIAAGLRRLADDPALRVDLVERGLRRARLYSWRRTAEATLRVYQELLS